MVFSSHIFLFLFLAAALGLYYLSPRSLKSTSLTLASFVFYGWWRPDFILLMVFSALVDWTAGAGIERARTKGTKGKGWLFLSLASNLGLLAYFKYANFGVESLNALIEGAGGKPITWAPVVLPVGISFYTFQTMSYTLDIYWGNVKRARNFMDYLCYVTMFPQLVAGPIVRYISVEDQLRNRQHTWSKFLQGVLVFQSGLAKKILFADLVAGVADGAFALPERTIVEAWVGIFAYSMQIYFDFSGYSDMAIGLGLMFGFRFPVNFDSPYRSQSITEFWRRWHISLSTWLRDYLYVPLGGNRKGELRTLINLAITMLLGGLWHGANWTFVAWGAYQGFWLIVERLAGKKALWATLPPLARIAVTFVVAMVGWVFFRAANLPAALSYLGSMFQFGGAGWSLRTLELRPLAAGALVAGFAVAFFAPNTQRLLRTLPMWWLPTLWIGFLIAILHLLFQHNVPFLYFQF